jgi:mono/diheme cytochrome c family protein
VKVLPLIPSLVFGLTPLFGADDPQGTAFFEQKIQPIFQDHCFKCHSHSGDKIKGGLVLDSKEGAFTGGDTGPAVVPGNLEKSLLIEAVSYANEDLQMPPKGKKLTDEQIALLSKWVKMGAPWPEETGKKTAKRPRGKITEEDRQWWSFQPLAKVQPPDLPCNEWKLLSNVGERTLSDDPSLRMNPIDAFIFQRLVSEGLRPAPQAEKSALLRRVYFDVTGLPPSPEQVAAFLADDSPDAYARLVDQLLASPRYGEHWARHWLDLVRYAESDGFRIDDYRPTAWRFRDYVVRAFNADKPYDRFVQEQLAGDELFPGDIDARIATGYLRHWIYEYNNRDVVGQWTNILNDVTDTTADVFLGMGVQCARCHDHKFDPILQKDYFRLQAFFAPLLPRDDLKLATPAQQAEYEQKLRGWEEETAALRAEITALETPHKFKAAEGAIKKFPPETEAMIRKPVAERTPWEHQIAELAYRQVDYEFDRLINKMRGADKEKLVGLYKQLSAFDKDKPDPLPSAFAATDVGPHAPPVTIPKKANLGEIEPGFLTILDEKPAVIEGGHADSTGRRATFAKWLTQPENPLSTRVMVNRVWQYHFGRGLVPTSSDFGQLGEKPSHSQLLDWLARRFVSEGWSLKKLHRLMLLSATYQQSTHNPAAEQARVKDPENRLLWRASTRRLEAEQIRDAVLATTGELDLKAGGASEDWSKPRRTIYTKVIRNTRDPLLDVFDMAEGFTSTSQRNTTTTPTQSLYMINSQWSLARARAFASRLRKESSAEPTKAIDYAYRLAFARDPSAAERAAALQFLESQEKTLAARAPVASDAPFVAEKMPFRDGRAAVLTPGTPQERLVIPDNPIFPKADFTAEAFIVLKSLYPTGEVRSIVSHWDGKRGHPGWSLGVTSKASRYKPQTLVLLLSGDQPWSDKDPIEPVFSGLQIDLGKPYFVAVSVNLDDATEKGITFYAKDLSNDDEPVQIVQLAHKVTSGIRGNAPLVIGGRGDDAKHVFDGLIDDVRISTIPLPQEQLLLTKEGVSEHTAGYWKFEADPGVYIDSSRHGGEISARRMEAAPVDTRSAAIADFCHALLNSNEFLYID